MMENRMLRVLGVRALLSAALGALLYASLCAFPSAARAGEHYVEIWNPPEARLVKPATPGKSTAGKPALIAHTMPKAATRRVADPLAKAAPIRQPIRHPVSEAARRSVTPSPADIPRIITPEGNVLRVSGGAMGVSVAR
jgi:hypothetical protein